MNSTYAKLFACDEAINNVLSLPATRATDRTLRDLAVVRWRIIHNAGPLAYGPMSPRYDVHRWQMTEEEWVGQE